MSSNTECHWNTAPDTYAQFTGYKLFYFMMYNVKDCYDIENFSFPFWKSDGNHQQCGVELPTTRVKMRPDLNLPIWISRLWPHNMLTNSTALLRTSIDGADRRTLERFSARKKKSVYLQQSVRSTLSTWRQHLQTWANTSIKINTWQTYHALNRYVPKWI